MYMRPEVRFSYTIITYRFLNKITYVSHISQYMCRILIPVIWMSFEVKPNHPQHLIEFLTPSAENIYIGTAVILAYLKSLLKIA